MSDFPEFVPKDHNIVMGVDCGLNDRFEHVMWNHRTENPDGFTDMSNAFGYICQEYWKPNYNTRSIELDICPYWIDKIAASQHFAAIWEWADGEVQKILRIVEMAIRELQGQDVVAHVVKVPYGWKVFQQMYIYGCRIEYNSMDVYGAFSSGDHGRFCQLVGLG